MLSAPALFPGYAQLAPFFFKILAIYSNFLLTNSAAQITIVTKLKLLLPSCNHRNAPVTILKCLLTKYGRTVTIVTVL